MPFKQLVITIQMMFSAIYTDVCTETTDATGKTKTNKKKHRNNKLLTNDEVFDSYSSSALLN